MNALTRYKAKPPVKYQEPPRRAQLPAEWRNPRNEIIHVPSYERVANEIVVHVPAHRRRKPQRRRQAECPQHTCSSPWADMLIPIVCMVVATAIMLVRLAVGG